jgi:uncharacterized protein YdaU (DUF1376 family)
MSRPFIAFYPAAYQSDTQHLTTLEHGCYFLLLQYCWQHGSIPLDGSARAHICKVSPQHWVHLRHRLNPYFDSLGRNKRATIERQKAEKTSIKQAMAGHRGAMKRWAANGHGHSHGHEAGTSHGIAIKKERITTTFTEAARESSTDTGSTPAKPTIPVTAELQALLARKRWSP